MRVFKSLQDQEVHKIKSKLQARRQRSYKILEKVNAAVNVADMDEIRRQAHAVNIKPVVRATAREPARRSPHE